MHDDLRSLRTPLLADPGLSLIEVRALIRVATDLADDLDVECAVAVVDAEGALQAVERAASIPGSGVDEALLVARRVLAGGGPEASTGTAGAVALDARGAVAVAGGPDGFALEACRAAAHALGYGRGRTR